MQERPAFRAHVSRLAAAAALVLALAVLASSHPVRASGATFTVTSTADVIDGNPGDGTCASASGCTLRAAVMEANALPGHDTINLSSSTYVLTLIGADDTAVAGDLDITDDVTITGAGAAATIIDGGAIENVLHVDPLNTGITAEISGVTVQNGSTTGSGGGINVDGNGTLTLSDSTLRANTTTTSHGGAMQNRGTATLTNVTISDNTAPSGFGGGIDNRGDATLTGVTISGNTAGGGGGGIHNINGTLTLVNSLVGAGNTAGSGGTGGGIENNGGTVIVEDSTVSGNTSATSGGGISNNTGTLTVTGTTVKGNTAASGGGGIRNEGTASVTNTTVTANSAPSGGGLDNRGTLTATNVTVAGNTASSGGGIWAFDATVVNTIFANNGAGGDCFITVALTSSYSLDSDGSCGLTGPGDIPNTDPLLGSLANYGGATDVYPLRSHSPAVDAGDSASCPSTDQRGGIRPRDGDDDLLSGCDIGAFELQPVCGGDGAVLSPSDVAIPDNDPGGVSSTVSFIGPGLGEIVDLNLCVAIPHEYVGDLIVTLTHVDTGTTATVIDRPGKTNGGLGCPEDDIFVLLDDEAGSPVENQCAAQIPSISGVFTPNSPLSVFDGEDLSGDWRLTVSDNDPGAVGVLDRWDLLPELAPDTPTPSPSGATATPTASATATATPTPTSPGGETVVWGDNNCSGSVDPVDSLLTLRHDAGLSANTGDCPEMGRAVDVQNASLHPWGDVDCGGEITPVDSLKLLRHDAGLGVAQAADCPSIGSEITIVVS